MRQSRSSIVDSSFAIAAMSGVLYFWGSMNIQGDAGAMEIPYSFLSRDLWSTVAYGLEGFASTYTLHLPDLLSQEAGRRWVVLATVLIGSVVGIGLYFLMRRSKYLPIVLAGLVCIVIGIHIMIASSIDMAYKVIAIEACLNRDKCNKMPTQNRLVFLDSEDSVYERTGILIRMNEKFVVMYTQSGLFIAPVGSIRFLETARQPLAK